MAKLVGMNTLQDHASDNLVERKNGIIPYVNKDNSRVTSVDILEMHSVNLSWRKLSYYVTTGCFRNKARKDILQDVSGCAPSGMLTVILGPSGSGKTTLLNIISGFRGYSYKGEVLVNGKSPSTSFYRDNSCIIPQEIYLFPHLTVRETISLAADLKLPSSMKKAEKREQVDKVLEVLRLTEVQSSKVTDLSGGEKKRLSIGQDLVSNPSLLLLDEPTSGLDSSLSYQCIKLLSDLAREGRTIICSIHQPSSSMFELFDNLHVLSKGRCIYSGPGRDLTTYLNSCGLECPHYYNPTEYIMDVACGVRPGEEILLKKEDGDNKGELTMMSGTNDNPTKTKKKFFQEGSFLVIDSHRYPTSFGRQFAMLIYRQFRSTVRRPALILLSLIANVALGGLIGLAYRDAGATADKSIANIGLLGLLTLILTFSAILPTLLTFPSEKMAVLREYHNGWYSVNSYFLAKTITAIPFNVIFPTLFVAIVYWLSDQIPETWRILHFALLTICLTLSVESIPLIIGSLCSPKVTVFLVPALCFPFVLFTTFFMIGNKLPSYIDWVSKVSPFATFYRGILVVVYGFDRPSLPCKSMSIFCLLSPSLILEYMDIKQTELYLDIGVLGASIAVFRLLGYICLNLAIRRLK